MPLVNTLDSDIWISDPYLAKEMDEEKENVDVCVPELAEKDE